MAFLAAYAGLGNCVDVTVVFHQRRQRVVAGLLLHSAGEGDLLFWRCFTNTIGEDNMLLLRDRWSRQRTFGNFLRIPPVRATYCCVSVFACTTGEGNVFVA